MVSFDIGDNRHHRLQMQERRVALIRFGNQITAMTQTSMDACCFHQTAVDESRIQTRFRIDAGDHRRGRGFTVGPGNGDTVTKTHQLCQHLRTADHRDTRFMGRNNFRVIRRNSAGHHHHARITHVFRAMIKENRGAQIRQLLRHRIRC